MDTTDDEIEFFGIIPVGFKLDFELEGFTGVSHIACTEMVWYPFPVPVLSDDKCVDGTFVVLDLFPVDPSPKLCGGTIGTTDLKEHFASTEWHSRTEHETKNDPGKHSNSPIMQVWQSSNSPHSNTLLCFKQPPLGDTFVIIVSVDHFPNFFAKIFLSAVSNPK